MKIPALIVLLSFYMAPTSNADSNLLTDDLREYAQKMEKDARPGQEFKRIV